MTTDYSYFLPGSSSGIKSVEEFIPDGEELDKSFLEDSPTNHKEDMRVDTVDSDRCVSSVTNLVLI